MSTVIVASSPLTHLRSLPPLPIEPVSPVRSRSPLRPLPAIPHPVACKNCRSCVTSSKALIPPSAYPPNSRSFRGFHGKASLFTECYNVKLSPPSVQLMATGAHTMQEITCATCVMYLGWKIVRAHERSEQWKDGVCLMELEHLFSRMTSSPDIDVSSQSGQISTDSDSSSLGSIPSHYLPQTRSD